MFIEINDGSCLENLQIIADESLENYEDIKKLTTGSAVAVLGNLIESQGKGQQWEMNAKALELISLAPDSYPLQKKRHTDEFLRTIAHLRPRTNKYGAVFRIRSELSFAIHRFFRERGFRYIHSPIITGSDCEGAGERLSMLEARMKETGLLKENYWWYLDSRRFGTVPHSGFGLGFERLIMLMTGTSNIRDVIPFPRTPNRIDF